jgi:ankyrin repeat protein
VDAFSPLAVSATSAIKAGDVAAVGALLAEQPALAEEWVRDAVDDAFWQACHGGQRDTAEYLLAHGADVSRVGWNQRTPLDIALTQEHAETPALADWLRAHGAKTSA